MFMKTLSLLLYSLVYHQYLSTMYPAISLFSITTKTKHVKVTLTFILSIQLKIGAILLFVCA